MEAIVDLNELAGQLAAAVLFLVPGLNTTWIIDRLSGRTAPAGTERLLKGLSWSVLIYLVASPWLTPRIGSLDERAVGGWELLVAGGLVLLVAPAILGLAVSLLRRLEPLQRRLRRATGIHPSPSAWDFAFTTFLSGFVLIRLKDGRLVGGSYGSRSFAATYPEPQDLFFERAWRLDGDGTFLEELERSRGVLVRRDVIESVQFFERDERYGEGEARSRKA